MVVVEAEVFEGGVNGFTIPGHMITDKVRQTLEHLEWENWNELFAPSFDPVSQSLPSTLRPLVGKLKRASNHNEISPSYLRGPFGAVYFAVETYEDAMEVLDGEHGVQREKRVFHPSIRKN